MTALRYFIGLHRGPAGEYTALAVLERPLTFPEYTVKPVYALRHLKRYPLGTPYPVIVDDTRTLLRTAPMPGSILVLDKTGVGQAVQRLFEDGLSDRVRCTFWPITIAVGMNVESFVNGRMFVAKQELVGTLQVLLQTRRLQLARTLPEATELVRELEAFRTKPTKLAGEIELINEFDIARERPNLPDVILGGAGISLLAQVFHWCELLMYVVTGELRFRRRAEQRSHAPVRMLCGDTHNIPQWQPVEARELLKAE